MAFVKLNPNDAARIHALKEMRPGFYTGPGLEVKRLLSGKEPLI